MLLGWFDARQATEIGISLADHFATRTVLPTGVSAPKASSRTATDALQDFLQRAEREVRVLPLNFYKKAKLANAFKWRLLEKGVAGSTANKVTQTLVMHLSMSRLAASSGQSSLAAPAPELSARDARELLAQGDQQVAQGAYAKAIESYQAFLKLRPHDATALNNLGAAYWKLGHYPQAEEHFRHAVRIKPSYPDAHSNLGSILRGRGHLAASENSLRRALKLQPSHVEARASLGLTLFALGRPQEAKPHVEKVLKIHPNHVAAMLCMAKIATTEGRFGDAETLIKRTLDVSPREATAWATLPTLRKMTRSDRDWLERTEAIAAGPVTPLEEADLRFAIGKYYDDVGDFAHAFPSYQRANELMKANAPTYDREERTRLVDNLIRSHSRERLTRELAVPLDEACASEKPVLIVGMMRSGTSLVEQIIASHPAVAGAGELRFWSALMQRHEAALQQAPLGAAQRVDAARAYLRELSRQSATALRVVDKAPVNTDYLGIIHSVFPRARIIYMRRDPIDTCLSCYFQQFSAALDYTMDLGDLAHYYRTHERLVSHWRTVLPSEVLLDVPYEELVSDQAAWTRKILDFIGLDWDERCLNFQSTSRTVATASAWQVRQKIYKSSTERWRNYEKFLGPLLELRDSRP